MCLSSLAGQFMAYARHERRLARTSCRDFHFHLHRFLRWLEANGYPNPALDAFCTPTIRRYLHGLSRQGLRPRTLRASLHPLRSFGDWLIASQFWTKQAIQQVNESLKEAAYLGITVCAASGDDRSCDAVLDGRAHADFPAVTAGMIAPPPH